MDTSTVKETVDKVDAELSEMGIDGVKENLKEILNIKDYLANQLPAVVGFGLKVILAIFVFFYWKKSDPVDHQSCPEITGKSPCRRRGDPVCLFCRKSGSLYFADLQHSC